MGRERATNVATVNRAIFNLGNNLLKKTAAAKLFTACEDGIEYDLVQFTSRFTLSTTLHGRTLSNNGFNK